MARLLITADLHYNHPRSRPLADDLIDRMNTAGGDVLLVVGDTAASDGDALEQCLSRFRFPGPKLLVAGNHELWAHGLDSHHLFSHSLPLRARALGWHWLEDDPFIRDGLAIVGSIGWYDYSFAPPTLGIPRRFYENKISPGAAERLSEFAHLLEPGDDMSPSGREVVARWNDGKFVKLGRSDETFLQERLESLQTRLTALTGAGEVIAAVHHLPFSELLPPLRGGGQRDFAKAFLGSGRIGELLLRFPNIRRVFCGHSHFPAESRIGPIHAVNVGSGYRHKTFLEVDASTGN
jgi:hypothetical protein